MELALSTCEFYPADPRHTMKTTGSVTSRSKCPMPAQPMTEEEVESTKVQAKTWTQTLALKAAFKDAIKNKRDGAIFGWDKNMFLNTISRKLQKQACLLLTPASKIGNDGRLLDMLAYPFAVISMTPDKQLPKRLHKWENMP